MSPSQLARDDPPALAAHGVEKTFLIPEEQTHTLKERALHPLRPTRHETFHALRGISFAVAPGEFFGIVGRNGSGKSTLLKCLAGIYRADRGQIWVNGRLSTFIELGVGFNLDLAALDNVVLNGIMLGLSPREARARYESVIEFAELEEFADLKLKNYSSGMHVRLAFSVAIQVDADILLIDEVLAVGDAAFQQKCFDVFNRMRDEGRTIVFVTHDMSAVNRFCHRAMLLERGRIVELGDPHEVADRYMELNFERARSRQGGSGSPRPSRRPQGRIGDGAAWVSDAWLGDEQAEEQTVAHHGEALTLKALVTFASDVEDPGVSLTIENDQRQAIVCATSERAREHTGRFVAGEQAVFAFSFHNVLAPGRYFPVFTVTRRGSGVLDRYEREFSFVVTASDAAGGLVEVPVQVRVTRAADVEERVRA
ncbi:MAG TPA: ABC transporter ATP-binding protein [Solirubrobacteraceae bacterium]|nr:ABC transporter ATP-binding protein [Solirubrobacteraceae bacterium]